MDIMKIIYILGVAIAANCFWVYVVSPLLDKLPKRGFFERPRKISDRQKNDKENNVDQVIHKLSH